jgi:hypothetical protein
MAQFSVKIIRLNGAVLDENQQHNHESRPEQVRRVGMAVMPRAGHIIQT